MKRATIIGLAVIGAVVAAGAGVAWWLLSSSPTTAEQAAQSYLDALASGDLDTIAALEGVPQGAQGGLIGEAFLSADSYLDDARIERLTHASDGVVEVRATADLAGERREIGFVLEQSGSAWVLRDHLVGLTVEAALDGGTALRSVLVGDAPAPVATPVPLLPAEYAIAAAPRDVLEGSTTVVVSGDEPAAATVTASLSAAATAHAQEQLDAYADACAQPAATVPEQCGIVVPWAADLASLERIAFRVDQYPVVALSGETGSFEATGGVLVATARGLARDGTAASFTYRADDWALRGSILFEGDEMVLAVH